MTEPRTLYLTTPIYYVNDIPHVGHAYTTIAADVVTRARRLAGHDAFLLTGTDEHGQNIERIAREKGIPEQQHCDLISGQFRDLWKSLDIRYDDFIRTTEDRHRRGALHLWSKLREATAPDGRPAIYRGKYSGWYCSRCEGFKDEEELKQPGNLCPDHELPCDWTEEENFFFRLSAHADWLRDEIESGRIRIDPVGRRNEVLSVIRGGLQDFSVSRARVKWGIPIPEQPDHVLYVWVDALSNYITALGLADDAPHYRRYWAGAGERFHLIGKDIIRFHCLYWPALLKAAGVPVPTRFFAQGWITKNGKKLSKTTGNVIDPVKLVKDHGPDAVRNFLLREGVYGQDWDFTDSAFITRFNADLANDLGNLVSRALTMVRNYCEGKVPPRPGLPPAGTLGCEVHLQTDAAIGDPAGLRQRVLDRYEQLDFAGALGEIWSWVSQLNQRIVQQAPWEMAKDPTRRGELEAFLYRLLEAIRISAVLVGPVMPGAAARILGMLGREAGEPARDDLEWGRLEPGRALGAIEPLFPRLDKAGAAPPSPSAKNATVASSPKKEKPVSEPSSPEPVVPPVAVVSPVPASAAAPASVPAAALADKIDIADFAKVELRVAQVIEAEKIPGSKKLLKLQVDLGDEKRQIVAGIADSYAPEALVGRKVVVVANLKPAKLMGVESNGMVLAATHDGKAVLLSVETETAPGSKVR
jgi:methionyl-tRNA synthetase